LPFPFSKKMGGRKKWKKRKGNFGFAGSLQIPLYTNIGIFDIAFSDR